MKATDILVFTAIVFALASSQTINISPESSYQYCPDVSTPLGCFNWCPLRPSIPSECTFYSSFKQIPYCAYSERGQFFDTNYCDVCSTSDVQAKREGYCLSPTNNPNPPTYPKPIIVPNYCGYGTTQVSMDDGIRGCVETVIPNCQFYRIGRKGYPVCSVCSANAERITAERFTHPKYGSIDSGIGCPNIYLNLGRICNDGVTLTSYGQYQCTSSGLYCPQGQNKGYFIPSRRDICLDSSEFVVDCSAYDDYGQGIQCSCTDNMLKLENGTFVCTSFPVDYTCKYWYYGSKDYVSCVEYCEGGNFAVTMIDGSTGCSPLLVPNCNSYQNYRGYIICRFCKQLGVRTVRSSDFTHPIYGSYNSGVGCPAYSSSAASCARVVLQNGNYFCN